MRKHIIWDADFNPEDYAWIRKDNPDISDEDFTEMAYDQHYDDLDLERLNLNIDLDQPIIVIADLGLWDGRRTGYSTILSGNIRDCLYSNMRGESYCCWYLDELGDLCCDEAHHDGTNHYIYRTWKESASASERDALLHKLYYNTATRKDITRATKRLGDLIAEVYGWKIRGMKKGA